MVKLKNVFIGSVVALFILTPKVHATHSSRTHGLAPETNVKEIMKDFGKVFKEISTLVSKGSFGDLLNNDIEHLMSISLQSKDMIPGAFDHLSEVARDELFAKYKIEMQAFIDEVLVLKASALASDKDGAMASIKRLSANKLNSHDQFKAP